MRYRPIDNRLFRDNRQRLTRLMAPNALAVVNANDILPTNADGILAMQPNSDLFYLTGVEQEETVLLLYPDAHEPEHREILFLREPTPQAELWEGHKLTKDEARKLTGVKNIQWLSAFPQLFHRLICECEHAYLNSNEHKRAVISVETRDARFAADCQHRYPLHQYHRLARLMHTLRAVKSPLELELIRNACRMTHRGFRRVARKVKPGVKEMELEAEFAHEFIREGGSFAYLPIIAAGANNCVLHYVRSDGVCRKGDLLLLDVAAQYANYNADMTRTLPIGGRFSRRQKQVYEAVLRVLRASIQGLTPGKLVREWQKEAEQMIERELVELRLLSTRQIKRQDPDNPAFKQYFMHGLGHPIGLDVHDVGLTTEPIQENWVMTVEPAIYVRAEGFGIRLENTVLVCKDHNVDLMEGIPLEPEEIEELMNRRS
jgi:Xaa-Pro aminopeptidase